MRSSKQLIRYAKLVFGLSLLAFVLLSQGNAVRIAHIFREIKTSLIFGLLLISCALTLTNVSKWNLFLRGVGQRVSYWRLVVLYLVGKFFSNFAPSTMGGDLVRIFMLGRNIGSQASSAATVVMERAMGMVGLVVVVVIACTVNPAMVQYPFVSIPVAGALVLCLLAVTAYFSPAFSDFVLKLCERLPVAKKFSGVFRKFLDAVVYYRSERRILLFTLLLSMQFHVIASFNVFVACLALGFHPQFIDILVITPVVLLLTAIPLSPRSIGWWEWCFGVLLANAGGSMAQGTAVALLLRAVTLVMSLAGGLLFAFDWKFERGLLDPALAAARCRESEAGERAAA